MSMTYNSSSIWICLWEGSSQVLHREGRWRVQKETNREISAQTADRTLWAGHRRASGHGGRSPGLSGQWWTTTQRTPWLTEPRSGWTRGFSKVTQLPTIILSYFNNSGISPFRIKCRINRSMGNVKRTFGETKANYRNFNKTHLEIKCTLFQYNVYSYIF